MSLRLRAGNHSIGVGHQSRSCRRRGPEGRFKALRQQRPRPDRCDTIAMATPAAPTITARTRDRVRYCTSSSATPPAMRSTTKTTSVVRIGHPHRANCRRVVFDARQRDGHCDCQHGGNCDEHPASTNAKRATLGVSDAITATAVSHKVRYNVESDRDGKAVSRGHVIQGHHSDPWRRQALPPWRQAGESPWTPSTDVGEWVVSSRRRCCPPASASE